MLALTKRRTAIAAPADVRNGTFMAAQQAGQALTGLNDDLGGVEVVAFVAAYGDRLRAEFIWGCRSGSLGDGTLQDFGAETDLDGPVFAVVIPVDVGAVRF